MKSVDKIVNNFDRDGYVKIKNLFSARKVNQIIFEVENIKKKFKKIYNPNIHYTKDKKINTIHDIDKFVKSKTIENITKDKRLLRVLKGILKSETKVRNVEFFLKPKKTGMLSPPHQDNAYWNIKDKRAVNVWIACTNSGNYNGGVYYLKGSHKLGLIDHELSHKPGSSQQVTKNLFKDLSNQRVCPRLTAGDCIIHHPEVVHGSHKNVSKFDRIGLVISYKAKNSQVDKKGLSKYKKILKKNLDYLNKRKK